jgi:glutathione S-transferase
VDGEIMILIGQYDSSFVRRVGIALTHYEIPFEHRPWSVFGDKEKIRAFNPLTRVPTLVLDNGSVLTDCTTILSELDQMVPQNRILRPQDDADRQHCAAIMALATGLADKGVSLFYELRLHANPSDVWMERCRMQIVDTVSVLEKDRAGRSGQFWFGNSMTHADIGVAASMAHCRASHPDLLNMDEYPALEKHCQNMEALPVFKTIYQEFIPPA